ncbi:ABC transporter ATP-binding protein [Nocardioides daphniae]|uniref:ABC-type quaternary amine transporter n=1 Tax=Nocardioides daphniae TaxID=402297 RepID=A0A4P7UGN6_9ACTN|nr:ABC transporter ATP-binding protein [Nocardioides daphniae]QCC77879.1 ABC transporter ATP-binding protein [Nocardioides daphniae]GGD27459.1 Fe(3+) ions import ATP-binding protein FbpC [Nocardioides daphniae]
MTTLHLRGVSKSFGTVEAVKELTLTVPHQSLTAVLGPSGCGKTTLLRLIAGFLRPDAGEIAFDDRVVAGPSTWVAPQQRRVGYLPQEGALFPHLDVAANIGFGLSRAERTPARIAELLDLVELPHAMASRQPHELSGGQQQRVSLARAMAPRPHLVLLDEPFSALDTGLRETTGRAVVRALRAAGATGLLITHDQNEAMSLSDQVATMRAGRLVQAATPFETYAFPADAEVARFVGGANVVAGTADGGTVTCPLGALATESPVTGEVRAVVRPEQVELTPAQPDSDVAAVATVLEVSYYGHDAAVRLSHGEGELLARVNGTEVPRVGDRVAVRVRGPVHTIPA